MIARRAVDASDLPRIPRRLERTAGIALLVLAVFLTLGLHLPSLVDALAAQPTSVGYTSSPTAFWIVKLTDLGMIVPAAVAVGVGLLRRAARHTRGAMPSSAADPAQPRSPAWPSSCTQTPTSEAPSSG